LDREKLRMSALRLADAACAPTPTGPAATLGVPCPLDYSFYILPFYVLPSLPQLFLDVGSVLVAEPEVFALFFAAAELTPEVVVSAPDPEVVSVAAEPEVFALFFAAAELSLQVVVLAVEPGVVFVAVVSVADVAEPQASVDIAVAFDVSVPVSLFVVEVDSSGRPKFLAFPNVDPYASSSSSVEVAG
jgi:hypothetical protein